MRSIGLDVGMSVDNQTNASGGTHTDYNFKFAKRFFNNRLSFSVGGTGFNRCRTGECQQE